MKKNYSLKIGFGSGSILLGAYLALNFQEELATAIIGLILIAFGIGLIASK